MLWRNADFSCHAARRGIPTTARGRARCAVAISTVCVILAQDLVFLCAGFLRRNLQIESLKHSNGELAD